MLPSDDMDGDVEVAGASDAVPIRLLSVAGAAVLPLPDIVLPEPVVPLPDIVPPEPAGGVVVVSVALLPAGGLAPVLPDCAMAMPPTSARHAAATPPSR